MDVICIKRIKVNDILFIFIAICIFIINVDVVRANGKEVCRNTPTPTIQPTQEPTVTPVATPSAEVTPEVTTNSVNTSTPVVFHDTTQAPAAVTCTVPFSAPVVTSITADDSGTLTVNWLESESNVDKFSIVYGLMGQPLVMGEDNIPGNPSGAGVTRSETINLLPIGASINAQVWSWKNGCHEESGIIDPVVN